MIIDHFEKQHAFADCEWTDTCGVASDCSCEEIQPFTVEDLVGDNTSIHAMTEVVVSIQNETASTETDNVGGDRSNTSSYAFLCLL